MMSYESAWCDRMYNNRELVPGYGAHLQRWAAESAAVLERSGCETGLRYGEGPREELDVFPARGPGPAPVLVFIHGGYWRALDKRDHAFLAPAFVDEGVCVVVPNYALCPDATVPQIVMQMVRALAWTWQNIAGHGGDPGRITVAGHSAGGQLAAMMLACLWPAYDARLPPDLVKGALSISGLHDLEPLMHTTFLQPSIRLTPRQVRMASPARLPAPARGRLLAVCGDDESEEFHRQNGLIRDAWGARVTVCERLPGRDHFSVLEALAERGHRLHRLALELVRSAATLPSPSSADHS